GFCILFLSVLWSVVSVLCGLFCGLLPFLCFTVSSLSCLVLKYSIMSGDGDCSEDTKDYIVKLRGLPWSATEEDIEKFFSDCKILGGREEGIHITASREGRPSGECFVELEDAEDLELALAKDRDHIGNRYIEVFKVNRAEMEWTIKRSGPQGGSDDDGCVRLRGLPFGCSKEEIANFFSGKFCI
ncbi:unnamed protein product, partial [Callosobruchus maculatus]